MFGSQGQQVPGATVLACSATSNRVVVANVGGLNDTSDVWVLDTTTGVIQYHRTYPSSTKTSDVGVFVVSSPDSQYLAETDSVTGSATIRRIADDSAVARLSGMEIHGFSWHGDLVLATPRPPDLSIVNSTTIDPVVIDWRTGRTVWHSPPAGASFGGRLAAQPGGEEIALDLRVGQHEGIWMVGPDGQGHAVDQDIQFLVTVLIGLV